MLNRALLLQQLQSVSDTIFTDTSAEFQIARESWQRIVADPTFIYKVRQIKTPWLVPDWYEALDKSIAVDPKLSSYVVLAVDGSQIYPDRHQGTSCFLVNIGTALLKYGTHSSPVQFSSVPHVWAGEEQQEDIQQGPEFVNCKRQELEFEVGLETSIAIKKELNGDPFIFLFDGSLIFWHLESKDDELKERFLHSYLRVLNQLYQEKIWCAGYISLPKSKELVNLIRIELCKFKIEGCTQLEAVNHIVDTAVASFFLQPHSRSIVFKSNAKIGSCYPPHLAPHFFYLDVGTEIVRIEIPAWIAMEESSVNAVAQMILNQAIKGAGYPVALAEAHEQAVVKGPDREFFYHLITKLGIEHKRQLVSSQKSMKKRGIGI